MGVVAAVGPDLRLSGCGGLHWAVEIDRHDDQPLAALGKHHWAQRVFDFQFIEAEAQGIEQVAPIERDCDRLAHDRRLDWNAGPVLVIPVPALHIQVIGQ